MKITCNILKEFGCIRKNIHLRLISWNNNPPKFDLHEWKSNTETGDGMVLSEEELKKLLELIDKCLASDTEDMPVCSVEKTPKKRGRKPKTVVEEVQKSADTIREQNQQNNIVSFPKEKPNIIALPKSNGKATVLECRKKLDKEREIYKDGDSKYVIDKLLELCDSSQDFRNNVMREDKSYAGGFEYMIKQVRNGYCMNVGNGCQYLDNELAYALFVDYFNMDEEKMKAEEDANKSKRGRKKGI